MGGKVLVPTQTMIRNLISARLASDVMGVPLIILARTDANAAKLITSDIDEYDKPFITGERTIEGFYKTNDAYYPRHLRIAITALCPPNPKVLDRTKSTLAF